MDEEEETPVKSSNLSTVSYNGGTRILEIRFRSGRLYRYSNVPKSVYDGLMDSPSLGSYFYRHIKGRFNDKDITNEY